MSLQRHKRKREETVIDKTLWDLARKIKPNTNNYPKLRRKLDYIVSYAEAGQKSHEEQNKAFNDLGMDWVKKVECLVDGDDLGRLTSEGPKASQVRSAEDCDRIIEWITKRVKMAAPVGPPCWKQPPGTSTCVSANTLALLSTPIDFLSDPIVVDDEMETAKAMHKMATGLANIPVWRIVAMFVFVRLVRQMLQKGTVYQQGLDAESWIMGDADDVSQKRTDLMIRVVEGLDEDGSPVKVKEPVRRGLRQDLRRGLLCYRLVRVYPWFIREMEDSVVVCDEKVVDRRYGKVKVAPPWGSLFSMAASVEDVALALGTSKSAYGFGARGGVDGDDDVKDGHGENPDEEYVDEFGSTGTESFSGCWGSEDTQ